MNIKFIFYKIINDLIITFDQFNVSLLNKSINLKKKKKKTCWPQTLVYKQKL